VSAEWEASSESGGLLLTTESEKRMARLSVGSSIRVLCICRLLSFGNTERQLACQRYLQ
jgi:hypothetical protein